jgi:hypothetical protein
VEEVVVVVADLVDLVEEALEVGELVEDGKTNH